VSDPKRDPALRELLDGLTVPALSPDFADRVVAAATRQAKPLPPPVPSRNGRRARWIRGHRVVIGVVALGLMSAGAAATAIFGDVAQTIPVIGPLIARVVPARAELETKRAAKVSPKAPEGAAAVAEDIPPPAPEAMPLPESATLRREMRREFVARRIVQRLEQRAERREALGLPPRPVRPAEARAVLRRLPPEERAALVERVRQIRQERRASVMEAAAPASPPPVADAAQAPMTPDATPAPTPPAEGETATVTEQTAPEATPQRIEQLRRLRAFRELQQRRRDARRQRLQQ